jgi:hypothetical protein
MHHADLDLDVTTVRAFPSDRDRPFDADQTRRGGRLGCECTKLLPRRPFVPWSLLTLSKGALFGPLWVTLWNLTGATTDRSSEGVGPFSGERRTGALCRGAQAMAGIG